MPTRFARIQAWGSVAVLVAASGVILAIAMRMAGHAYLPDDSYISLTYAKNLAAGNGFTFNRATAIFGTTTPLLTIVMGGLKRVLPQIALPTLAIFFTALCWIATLWVVYWFRADWGLSNWQAALIGIVLATSGWPIFLGMEIYLFLLLFMLSISLFLRQQYLVAGIVSGLLFLTRGEGALLPGVLGLTVLIQLWKDRQLQPAPLLGVWARLTVGFLIIVIPWEIYAWATFGTLLRDTLAAKQAQMQTGSPSFLKRLINEWVPLWGGPFRIAGQRWANPWWLLVLVGAISVFRQRRSWLIPLGWVAIYIAGHTLLGIAAYWWYQLPVLFMFNILFALGAGALITWAGTYVRLQWLKGLIVGLLLTWMGAILIPSSVRQPPTPEYDLRGPTYTQLSQWFRENTHKDQSIAFVEVGYLGYYTDNTIIDLLGLILPDLIPLVAERNQLAGFWRYEPDFFVYNSEFDWLLKDIVSDERFQQQYQIVTTLPGPRSAQFQIYQHVP